MSFAARLSRPGSGLLVVAAEAALAAALLEAASALAALTAALLKAASALAALALTTLSVPLTLAAHALTLAAHALAALIAVTLHLASAATVFLVGPPSFALATHPLASAFAPVAFLHAATLIAVAEVSFALDSHADSTAYSDARDHVGGSAIDRRSDAHARQHSDHGRTGPDALAEHVAHETDLFDVLSDPDWCRIADRQG